MLGWWLPVLQSSKQTGRSEAMKFIRIAAVLASILAFATPTHAISQKAAPHAEGGKVAVGLICKNARDLKNLFQTQAWTRPRPDPELAVREVNILAHDPKACELDMVPYTGEPEQVDRIVRRPNEVYLIIRFMPLNGIEYRYMLLLDK